MSNTRLPRDERREQLLRVARHTFASNGFHGTSMNEIAEVAGVTKPVLYQHFDSKRDLFVAVLNDIGTRIDQAVFNQTTRTGSPKEQVKAGFSGYLDFIESDRSGFKILVSGSTNDDPEFRVMAKAFETKMAESVASFIAIDELDDNDRLVLAYGIVGLVQGVVKHWLGDGAGSHSRTEILDHLTHLAWRGLRS